MTTTLTNHYGLPKPPLGSAGIADGYDTKMDAADDALNLAINTAAAGAYPGQEMWIGTSIYPTLDDFLADASITEGTAVVSNDTHVLTDNRTLKPGITLRWIHGGVIELGNYNLTINGSLDAGLYQIFSCTGTGKVIFAAGSVPTIYPQWWGASPSATGAVNAAAIQASFTALTNNTSWTLPPGDYTCNASLVLGAYGTTLSGLNMTFKGKLLFDSCSGLDIRGVRYSEIRGIKVLRIARDWPGNNFGVKFNGMRRSNIGLDFIQNFTYGFYLDGDGSTGSGSDGTNEYLTFNLGSLSNNQYGEYVTALNGGVNTECTHYGGQFGQDDKAAVTGDWCVYLNHAGDGSYPIENFSWYNPSFEQAHNGMYLAGYTHGMQMFLSHPRFEAVDNIIEAAPTNLTWIQGMQPIDRADMATLCPRMIDSTGKSIVNIIGSGYYDLDGYGPYAMGKEFPFTWYNQYDLAQVTNLEAIPKDKFCLTITDRKRFVYGSEAPATTQNLNKNYEAAAAPGSGGAAMTYAKGAVVWNTNIASGQPMGWVCSVSGSTPAISGTCDVTGTAMTIVTPGTGTWYYLFVGAFFKINGVQHQIKKITTYTDPSGPYVFELYANLLGGPATGATLADSQPTWVPMVNCVSTPTTPAVPASTVEQANANAYPVRVAVTGGTVTAIEVGPTGATVATGATTGAFILQPGHCIKITYSAAPTWNWLGL